MRGKAIKYGCRASILPISYGSNKKYLEEPLFIGENKGDSLGLVDKSKNAPRNHSYNYCGFNILFKILNRQIISQLISLI